MSSKKLADRAGMVPVSPSPAPSSVKSNAEHELKTGSMMVAFALDKSVVESAEKSVKMAKESEELRVKNEELRVENDALKSAEISIDSIIEVKDRRRVLSPDKFAELVENLRFNALAVPVTVRSVGGGKFELISGHNRMHAFIALGRKSIPAAVLNFDDKAASKAAFFANLISDTLPDYEKYKGFKALMGDTGQTQVQCAKEAGISVSAMSQLMEFDKLPKEAVDLIAARPDRVSFSAVVKLNKLDGVVDGIRAIVDGASLAEAISIASQKKATQLLVKPEPVIVKNGRKRVAEIVRRQGTVSVKFKDESFAVELAVEIENLIRARLKK